MNLLSQLLKSATEITGIPGETVASLLKMLAEGAWLFPREGADSTLELLMSGLAGVATAMAVAIALIVYFQTGYRSVRDIVRHGLLAAIVLGLLAFAAYDMRHAALAYLGIDAANPAAAFEMRWPKAASATPLEARPSPTRI